MRTIVITLTRHGKLNRSQILDILPGATDQSRMVVVVETTFCGHEHLVLRQETHQAGVGWFTQTQIAIEPEQLAGLKSLLTGARLSGWRQNASGSPETTDEPVILSFPVAG